MNYVDLNDLGLMSYNELIRLKFIENKDRDLLSAGERLEISNRLCEKLGDTYLEEVFKFENNKLIGIDYTFTEGRTFKELILLLALCYINNMDLNNYFSLKIQQF